MRVSWKKKYLELVELIENEEDFEFKKSDSSGYISYVSLVEDARNSEVDGEVVEDNRSKFLARLRKIVSDKKVEEEKIDESEVKEEVEL